MSLKDSISIAVRKELEAYPYGGRQEMATTLFVRKLCDSVEEIVGVLEEKYEGRIAALEARLALLEKRDDPDGAVHFSYGDGGGI